MAKRCLLYYVTDRAGFPGDESARRRRLLKKIAEAARCTVDYIQLREKDLPACELESLAREALRAIRENSPRTENLQLRTENSKLDTNYWPLTTALLINSRTDIALAVRADGVHLRSDDISTEEVREVWTCGRGRPFDFAQGRIAREATLPSPLITVSCHSPAEVVEAEIKRADLAVFAPVFEKKDTATRPAGLGALKEACRAKIPVLALGGVTLENAKSCLAVGAAGIAAIRLFQENSITEIVRKLRF